MKALPTVALVALLATSLSAQTFVDRTFGLQGPPVDTGNLFFGTGMAVVDLDGDGDLDLVVPQKNGLPIRVWENVGRMNFIDRTTLAGLGNSTNARGVSAADIDNDGDQDLLFTNWRAQPQLFINIGSFQFSEEAILRGVFGSTSKFTAAFADYDKDGWVDFYIANRVTSSGVREPNQLYRNLGDGHFQEVAFMAGVDHRGLSFATTFFDYDEDGWPDIAVTNDKGSTPSNSPNEIFRNNGDGTFTAVAASIGADIGVDGMGIDYADVFNDGGIDYYCSDTPVDHHFMRFDSSTGSYVDDTYNFGLDCNRIGWMVKFEDFNNDGWRDLFINHVTTDHFLFLNAGTAPSSPTPWTQVSTTSQLFSQVPTGAVMSYTSITADLDNDGDHDLICRWQGTMTSGISIHENTLPDGTNWLKFETVGTRSHRDAYNTKVDLFAGGLHQRNWTKSGVGYISQNDSRAHFGLGTSAIADEVRITWPSGQVQRMFNVPSNQIVRLSEPALSVNGDVRSAIAPLGAATQIDWDCNTDAGLMYAIVLSATAGPATVLGDGTELPVAIDPVTTATLEPGNPVFAGSVGVMDGAGHAQATLVLPNLASLAGIDLYATGLTFDPINLPLEVGS